MKKTKKKPAVKKGETIDDYKDKYFGLLEDLKKKTEEPAPQPKKAEPLFPEDDLQDGEMEQLLLEFRASRAYLAYKKYNVQRIQAAETSLYSLDPYKDTTQVARNQGVRMGLMDLDIYVDALQKLREQENKDGGRGI